MKIAILLFALSGFSATLRPWTREESTYAMSVRDVFQWITEQHLKGCTMKFLGVKNEEFSSSIISHLLEFTAESKMPFQIGEMHTVELSFWQATACDVYIIVSKNLTTCQPLLDTDDKLWNWKGRYILISLSTRSDLGIISGWYKLQKTLDVVFLMKGHNDHEVSLMTHQLYSEESLKYVTLWRNGGPVSPRNIFPERVRNLKGHELRVFTFNHAPSVFSSVDSSGFLHNVSGIDVEVVKAMGQAMNFVPVFEHPGPARWGTILPNGTHTGMVGRISNDEAEIGVGNVFVTEVRARYITFTIPYDYERACFITPSPRELPKWKAVINPFSLHVWILVLVAVMSLCFIVHFFSKGLILRDRQSYHNLETTSLYIVAMFCNQASPLPMRSSMKVLFSAIIFCSFVVTLYYSTNLTAYMMVKAVEPPYTSIEQIVKEGYAVGGFSDFWRGIFQDSENKHVQQLGKKFFSFFPDITPYLKKVVSREVVLLENTQHLEYLKSNFYTNREGESPLRLMLEECINPFGIGALLRRNSPLKESIDMAILHMREGGLVDKFFQMVLEEFHESDYEGEDIAFDKDERTANSDFRPLSLQHLQGAFLLLGFGTLLAVISLVLELLSVFCGHL